MQKSFFHNVIFYPGLVAPSYAEFTYERALQFASKKENLGVSFTVPPTQVGSPSFSGTLNGTQLSRVGLCSIETPKQVVTQVPVVEHGVEEPSGRQQSLQVDHEHEEVLAVVDGLFRLGLVQDDEEPVDQTPEKRSFAPKDLERFSTYDLLKNRPVQTCRQNFLPCRRSKRSLTGVKSGQKARFYF